MGFPYRVCCKFYNIIMTKQEINKPVIDTIINTAAIALTALGIQQVTAGNLIGYLAIAVGIGLELIKYLRRKYL